MDYVAMFDLREAQAKNLRRESSTSSEFSIGKGYSSSIVCLDGLRWGCWGEALGDEYYAWR